VRIALKITLALTLWTIGVLVVMSDRELDHEFEIIDRDLSEGLLLMGRALQPLVEDAWRRGGDQRVVEALGAAYASEQAVRLRWFGPDLDENDGLDPGLASVAREAEREVDERVVVWPPGDVDGKAIYAYVPLRLGEGRTAVLELRRSLDVRGEFAARSRRQLIVTLAVIGSCAALMAIVLGWLLVGQRVGRLVAMARAVGRGDPVRPVPATAGDELSELTRAMNRMVEDLADARARNDREADERERLTRKLRHADRLSTIGALMSRLAHEIGTPLNVIAARSKLIARGQATGDAIPENARIAAEQADRIAEIIRSFLDFAREAREPMRDFEVRRVVEHAGTLLSGLARERKVELVIGTQAPGTKLHGDLLLLQQAVTNLVVNALDVAPAETRVTVVVGEAECTPPPGRGRGAGRYVSITVGDRGPGIEPKVLPHMFEPFFTTKPSGAGTGLGLPIAAGIVHEHGGWIDVRSEPNRGTQISVYLPFADKDHGRD
jgi:two-component system, NtrC family, sensor kinase